MDKKFGMTITNCLLIKSSSLLISGQRLSNFTIYGSINSHSDTANATECAYQEDPVNDSLKLTCTSPVMAR